MPGRLYHIAGPVDRAVKIGINRGAKIEILLIEDIVHLHREAHTLKKLVGNLRIQNEVGGQYQCGIVCQLQE